MDANSPRPPGAGGGQEAPNAHGVAVEPDVVPSAVPLGLFALLAVITIVCAAIVFVFFHLLQKQADRKDRAEIAEAGLDRPQDTIPPPPRLQIHAVASWQEFRQAENQRLTTYGWLDRSQGAVHVPIERAIDLVVERGIGPLPPSPLTIPAAPAAPLAGTEGKQ